MTVWQFALVAIPPHTLQVLLQVVKGVLYRIGGRSELPAGWRYTTRTSPSPVRHCRT